ncbi:MAG TPA: GNAT family N-acetyltransferase [Chroococcidiopsis sp.]
MIRLATCDDMPALLALAKVSGLFEPGQIEDLAQMLAEYFHHEGETAEFWLTDCDSVPVGMAYVAPERMTEGTYNLYLLAVHPNYQRQGRGKALLHYVEQMLVERGERILLVETSGTEDFDYVREFYRHSGYAEEARIREFYAPGVDKIVFRKVLTVG